MSNHWEDLSMGAEPVKVPIEAAEGVVLPFLAGYIVTSLDTRSDRRLAAEDEEKEGEGEGEEEEEEEEEEGFAGCSCVGNCGESPGCECLAIHGGLPYCADMRLQKRSGHVPSATSSERPIFECNENCSCGHACVARLVGEGLQRKVQVFHTASKGWGLRTLDPLQEGSFVCEYAGEIITQQEAEARWSWQRANSVPNYIVTIKEHFSSAS